MKSILIAWVMLLAIPVSAQQYAIQHLEPANWWVGMRYHQVEILVHGEDISELTPGINYPGVTLVETKKVDNPNYLFITLDISPSAQVGQFAIDFTQGGKTRVSTNYVLNAREKNSAQRRGFDSSDVIYLITPDRFANGDPRNDSLAQLTEKADRKNPGGRHGGDIAGMIRHLDYIADMGFTQIWPNPLLENNQPAYSYHGYAATHNYLIDARFGSNEDFKKFVTEARKKGIGVIQDIILNHIGSEHWWMKDLPSQDWLNNPQTYVETNHRRTTIQDPYAAPADKAQFVGGWFSRAMPDLNQRNPLVARYLIQNTLWWIEYAGLSGIREDTYGYADEKFLTAWAKAVMEEYPNLNIVGEEWSSNPNIVAHWQKGKDNPSGHVPYAPSMMDFGIHDALRIALLEKEGWDTGLIRLYETLANDFIYPDPYNLVIFPENHDTSRIYSFLHEDAELFRMAMVYMATMRGIPQFYYGSEILMTSPRERDDGAVRADMPGGWRGDDKNAFTGKGLNKAQRDTQAFIKRLLNWRKNATVVHSGKLQHFAPVDGVYVYYRYDDENTLMVVLNKNDTEVTLDLKRFNDLIADNASGIDVLTGKKVNLASGLTLRKKSSTIIELR